MDFKKMNRKKIFEIVKTPIGILIGLTCVGLIINFFDNLFLIIVWWIGVLLVCGACASWAGYNAAKMNLSSDESGVAGAITWLVPGAVGLSIGGITAFINALLWGAVEGYEAFAFIGGLIIIIILLALGAGISFVFGLIGGSLGKKKATLRE